MVEGRDGRLLPPRPSWRHFFCDPGFRNVFVPWERFASLMDGPTILDDEMFSHAWMRRWSFAMCLLCFTAVAFWYSSRRR